MMTDKADTKDLVRRSKRTLSKEVADKPVTVQFLNKQEKRKKVKTSRIKDEAQVSRLVASESEYLLYHPKSCLKMIDLNGLLNQATWSILTAEEQSKCLKALPAVDKILLADGTMKLKEDFFTYNHFLQDAFREFQNDLRSGFLTASYIQNSQKACDDRRQGQADAFKDEQFERYWGDR